MFTGRRSLEQRLEDMAVQLSEAHAKLEELVDAIVSERAAHDEQLRVVLKDAWAERERARAVETMFEQLYSLLLQQRKKGQGQVIVPSQTGELQ